MWMKKFARGLVGLLCMSSGLALVAPYAYAQSSIPERIPEFESHWTRWAESLSSLSVRPYATEVSWAPSRSRVGVTGHKWGGRHFTTYPVNDEITVKDPANPPAWPQHGFLHFQFQVDGRFEIKAQDDLSRCLRIGDEGAEADGGNVTTYWNHWGVGHEFRECDATQRTQFFFLQKVGPESWDQNPSARLMYKGRQLYDSLYMIRSVSNPELCLNVVPENWGGFKFHLSPITFHKCGWGGNNVFRITHNDSIYEWEAPSINFSSYEARVLDKYADIFNLTYNEKSSKLATKYLQSARISFTEPPSIVPAGESVPDRAFVAGDTLYRRPFLNPHGGGLISQYVNGTVSPLSLAFAYTEWDARATSTTLTHTTTATVSATVSGDIAGVGLSSTISLGYSYAHAVQELFSLTRVTGTTATATVLPGERFWFAQPTVLYKGKAARQIRNNFGAAYDTPRERWDDIYYRDVKAGGGGVMPCTSGSQRHECKATDPTNPNSLGL